MLKRNFIPLYLTLCMWFVFLLERYSGIDLGFLGINPRHFSALPCILTAPFIHGSWGHLLNNTFSFLILGLLFFNNYPKISTFVFLVIYLSTGFLVWLIARTDSYHIGMSGVIYGLASFLFFSGFYRGNKESIALSLLVALLYGSMVWGVLPYQPSISWESHLSGGIVGLIMAFIFRNIPSGEDEIYVAEESNTDKKDFNDFLDHRKLEKS